MGANHSSNQLSQQKPGIERGLHQQKYCWFEPRRPRRDKTKEGFELPLFYRTMEPSGYEYALNLMKWEDWIAQRSETLRATTPVTGPGDRLVPSQRAGRLLWFLWARMSPCSASGAGSPWRDQGWQGPPLWAWRAQHWTKGLFWTLRSSGICLVSFGLAWDLSPFAFLLFLPLGMGMSILCLSRHRILEAYSLSGFTGSQLGTKGRLPQDVPLWHAFYFEVKASNSEAGRRYFDFPAPHNE